MGEAAMGEAPKLRGVDHLALRSFDSARMVEFYRDVMGFRFLGATSGGGDETGRRRFLLTAFELPGGVAVDFFEVEGDDKPPADTNRHIAFGVDTLQDLDAWRAHLEAHGVWVSDVTEHDDHVSRYLFDPSDNFVEITVRTKPLPAEPEDGLAAIAAWNTGVHR